MAISRFPANVFEAAPGRSFYVYTDCQDTVPGSSNSTFNEVKSTSVVGVSLLDKHGGQWKLDCGQASPAANDVDAIFTKAKFFEFGNGKSFGVRVRLDFAEANTNKSMLFFGFSTVVTAGMIVDTTGQPIGTFDGVGMYKPANQLFWSVVNSVSTTQNKKDSNGTAYQQNVGSSSTQEWEIHVTCIDSTTAKATFKVDGNSLVDANGNELTQTWTYTGAGAMAFYMGCKLNSTTRETMVIHKISLIGSD